MDKQTQQRIAAFLQNATDITQRSNFGGAPNHAMFWAHRDAYYNSFNRDVDDAVGLNNLICGAFIQSQNPRCYKLDAIAAIDDIWDFFEQHQHEFDSENLKREHHDAAWEMFSQAFADAACGDHAFIAANDMEADDFFVRIELPVIQQKFSHVTTLEPIVNDQGLVDTKLTEWKTDDWLHAQKAQWENPYYYLDGSSYPKRFTPCVI